MMKACIGLVLCVFLLAACTVSQAPDTTSPEMAQRSATETPVPTTTAVPTSTPTIVPTPTKVPTPTITPTPPPPDADEIVAALVDAWWGVQTYACRIEIEARLELDGMILPLNMMYDLQYRVPDRGKGQFEMRAFGETKRQDLITIGDVTYYRNEGSSIWMVVEEQSTAPLAMEPDETLADVLRNLEFVAQETLDDREVYHIRGENRLLTKQLPALFGDLGIEYEETEPAVMDIWIGVEDSLLYEASTSMTLMGGLPELDEVDTAVTVTIEMQESYSDYGRRFTISAPETPSGTIAFISDESGADEVHLINADGSGRQQLTKDAWAKSGPAWSPDGEQLVFAVINVNQDIYSLQLANGVMTQLTDTPYNEAFPEWSPDGTQLAVESNQSGNWDIYLMNAAGSAMTNITQHPAPHDIYPAWSPDGTRIAFGSDRDGFESIYVMDANGGNLTRLTNDPTRSDGYPTWSPDGTRIAFSAFTAASDAGADLFVMNADGSELTRLTDHPADDLFPSWSPDGTRIAFSSSRAGDLDIFILYLDSMEIIQLTSSRAVEAYPAWKPCTAECDPEQLSQMTLSRTAVRWP